MPNDHLLNYLPNLSLTRLGDEEPAGLWVTSLPIRPNAGQAWTLGGQPTHVKPLGNWPGMPSPGPRRLLLAADAGGDAPETIRLAEGRVDPETQHPTAEMVTFAHESIEGLGRHYWERSFLKIEWQGRWLGLAMGMRVNDEFHWWEGCNLVVLSQTGTCLEIEMGGAIPRDLLTLESALSTDYRPGLHPHLHKHNWLNGHIYARLHANGVCEIFAHHINSMFFDDGGDLHDAVPVLGLRADDVELANTQCGSWDGSRRALQLGDIALDLTETARLATPARPGSTDVVDDFLVLQPYLGMEMFGGELTEGWTGDTWICRAEQQVIPKGFARTLRFSASLNPERPARVARYLAPDWWYGVCEEFIPQPLLPVSNVYDAGIDSARKWVHKYMVPAGFEEGLLPNHYHGGDPSERQTPGAEGDSPGAMFQMAYRTGDAMDYECAMRASYAFVDVFVDHTTKRVRMQGYAPPAVALPLQRMQSGIFAWLETGDQYCLNTAEAVLDTAYWWHKNSWPRRAVGRDSRLVHSQILLYRYNNDVRSLQRARDMIADIGAAQWEDGSFGDQAGGTGFHSSGAYLAKPWMGWLATFGVLDYLEVVSDDAEAQAIVDRFVEWSMSEIAERDTPSGGKAMGWIYQHTFRGKSLPDYDPPARTTMGGDLFHFDYLARLMTWMSEKTGDPRYFDAWARSYEGRGAEKSGGYWEGISTFLFLPWTQARLWNARLMPDGKVEIDPKYYGNRTPPTGTISTPDGPLTLTWSADRKLQVPQGSQCQVEEQDSP